MKCKNISQRMSRLLSEMLRTSRGPLNLLFKQYSNQRERVGGKTITFNETI